MPKPKFFVSRDKFSGIAQIFYKFVNAKHNWKIKKQKNVFKTWLKNWYAFWQAKLKYWHVFGMLAHQVEQLTRL